MFPSSSSPLGRFLRPAAAALVLLTACVADPPAEEPVLSEAATQAPAVSGPLCDLLPTGTSPGAPVHLATEPADVALTWIPVLTTFEAGLRATGLDEELRTTDGVTILAPTDDAFAAAFSASTMDELLLSRHDELRALLRAHLVDGSHSLAELLDMGSVTALSGDTYDVTAAPQGGMLRFDDRAETVCADYDVSNARIHVIGAVLGEHPEPAATEEPHVG